MARKIIGIKVCYYLIKIFLHNKIHFKNKEYNNNNNTHIAAIAPLPLTTHPR